MVLEVPELNEEDMLLKLRRLLENKEFYCTPYKLGDMYLFVFSYFIKLVSFIVLDFNFNSLHNAKIPQFVLGGLVTAYS